MISTESYELKINEIKYLDNPKRTVDPEKEPVFQVDLNTKKITVPSAFRNLAVRGDHNAEVIWFAFDPIFDGELLEDKSVGLQFVNAINRTGLIPSQYHQYDSNTNGKLLVGWPITQELTEAAGTIEISIRFYDVSDVDMTYSLGTEPVKVNILEGLYVTSEDENLTPPADSLSQLVSKIEKIYQNNQATQIDYSQAQNKPSINPEGPNRRVLLGKMYTNKQKAMTEYPTGYEEHYIPISYNDLNDYPMINGHPLTPNSTSTSLGITVPVDNELSSSSRNPVENKVVYSAIESIVQDLDAVKEELEGMTYVPLSISNFYHTYGLAERGSTVNSITFEWKLNGNAVELILDEDELDVTQTSITLENLKLEEDKKFILVAKDRKGTEVSATADLLFAYKVFKGTSSEPIEYNSDFLNSLSGELQLTRENNFNVNAGVGEYIYYAVPSSYGDCIFTSGGFTGGFKKVATLSHTNDYGSVTNYDIWKSDYSGLGDTNIIVS